MLIKMNFSELLLISGVSHNGEVGASPHPTIFFENLPPPIKTNPPMAPSSQLKNKPHHWNMNLFSIKRFLEKNTINNNLKSS